MTPAEDFTGTAARLRAHREWILSGEFCSLFHDLGKLSSKFIEYRQTWHLSKTGWSEDDPHEHDFLSKHDQAAPTYRELMDDFGRKRQFMVPSEDISIAHIMNSHARKLEVLQTKYERALKVGDYLDSAHQRNNPLFSGEQTPRSYSQSTDPIRYPVYTSNVFGYESASTRLIPSCLDEKRAGLYKELESHPDWRSWWTGVPDAASREACLKAVRDAFEFGLGDTTRPVNDTSLWEHTYSVASLTKAIQAAYSIYGDEVFSRDDQWWHPPLMLWGMGWDPVRFIGKGQRIHDLAARREVMKRARDSARKLIEFDWALGNTVYEDDGTMVFVIPDWELHNSESVSPECTVGNEYRQLIRKLELEIVQQFGEATCLELCPQFAYQPAYRASAPDLTKVVDLLAKIRTPGNMSVPFEFFEKTTEPSTGSSELGDICPICRIRQSKKGERVCGVCLDRRVRTAQKQRDKMHKQVYSETPFLSEISDENRRIAVVVARFGLEDWLSGEMVRTTFVTEADGLEREMHILLDCPTKAFEAYEQNAFKAIDEEYGLDWDRYDFSRIQGEVRAACLTSKGEFADPELAKSTYFLYGRRNNFEPKTSQAWPDDDVNPKIAKTPTASRLLNAWRTTERFFTSWVSEADSDGRCRIHEAVPPRVRAVHFVDALPVGCREFQPYSGNIDGQAIEFTVDRGEKNSLSVLRGKIEGARLIQEIRTSEGTTIEGEIRVGPERGRPELFSPFRVILATPELFLILVPADRALDVVQALRSKFEEKFGKVIGKLSFSLGSIFFQEQQPMFVVLDAARRMLRNFESLQNAHRRSGALREGWEVSRNDGDGFIEFMNGFQWRLSTKLGEGMATDSYHPYSLVENCDDTRKSYQKTPMGNEVHISDVMGGDIIHPPASDFDFEFLDSSAARFRISLGSNDKRPNYALNNALTRPIPIEALSENLIATWKLLASKGLTDSSLREMLTLLITKLEEWHIQLPILKAGDPGQPTYEWTKLVEQQITHRLSELGADERMFVLKQVMSGLFFETAFLHLHILKKSLESGD